MDKFEHGKINGTSNPAEHTAIIKGNDPERLETPQRSADPEKGSGGPGNPEQGGEDNHKKGMAYMFMTAVEIQDGIPAICKPFENCTGPSDFVSTLAMMDHLTLGGVFMWLIVLGLCLATVKSQVALLFALSIAMVRSAIAVGAPIMKVIRSAIFLLARR